VRLPEDLHRLPLRKGLLIKAGRITRVARRVLPVCLMLCLLSLLSLSQPRGAPAQQPEATDGQDQEVGRVTPLTGIFVVSLHDLDTVDGTFGVDYWVWSVYPEGRRNPLESMAFRNAEQVDERLPLTEASGERLWSQRKIRAIVQQDWDLSNFPFDRHVLEIEMEEGFDTAATLTYRPDTANSGYNEEIEIPGWRITDFRLTERTVDYPSDFGDPALSEGESSYSRLVASMEIQRQNTTVFFRLISAACVAMGIALLTFLMLPTDVGVFTARMTLLVGALFATVISMQFGEQTLGATQRINLVDKLHILTLIYIFVAAALTLISRKLCASEETERARRGDRISLQVFGSSFVLITGALIAVASIVG
jgi:hypothetical protein